MTTFKLKGGFTTEDQRLGRLPEFDERSRKFRGVDKITKDWQKDKLRGRAWGITKVWNQGIPLVGVGDWDSSACTGYSCAYDLVANPRSARNVDDYTAFEIYRKAQTLDEWPGEAYEGSSVLGAAKAAMEMGWVGEYHWAFGIDEALQCLAWLGPIVVGTDWLKSMMNPNENGLITVEGEKSDVAGGHAYMFRSIILSPDTQRRLLGRSEVLRKNTALLRLHQSWGRDWGINGEGFMWADDLDRLLRGVAYPGECRITTVPLEKVNPT